VSGKQLGVAVIGRPQSFFAEAIDPYARYAAGCDLDEACCNEARERFDIPTFADYRDILTRDDVDVVFVKTPNHVHCEPAVAALEAGKHVFCEKPMALTMEDCRRMTQAAREARRLLQVDLELRSSHIPKRIKEIIDSGELGEVRRILFHHYQGAWDLPSDHWRMNPETSGGIFPEKLVHEVDLFRWFAGEIDAVQSFAAGNVIPQSPWPDCLQSMFWFEEGALGSMLHTQTRSATNVGAADFASHGHELWFDVIGTEGSLRADAWHGSVEVYRYAPGKHAGTRTAHFSRREDYRALGFQKLGHDTPAHFREFLRRIQAGEMEQQPPEDVLRTMAATFAAERSIHSGERETVQAPA
jgi:predicted dehydrogenase